MDGRPSCSAHHSQAVFLQCSAQENHVPSRQIIYMQIAALPENEAARLAELQRYEILDTPPEEAFDDLT